MFIPAKNKVLSVIFTHNCMNTAYLCLGGNIGDREASMRLAVTKINELAGATILASSFYETEAWGVTGQQAYLNCCIAVETKLSAGELITLLLTIEKELGRTRDLWQTYEPRTIDIDILFFNKDIITQDHLIVPHPRLHLRKFVLIPLNEIASKFLHPVLNKTIFNLLEECKDASSVKLYGK